MTRLSMIRAEIQQIEQHLHAIHEDDSFHPWMAPEAGPRVVAMRTRLRKLRQQEFMLENHAQPAPSDNVPLFRQNGAPTDKEINVVVFLLLVVTIVGVSVAGLLHMAGALTQ